MHYIFRVLKPNERQPFQTTRRENAVYKWFGCAEEAHCTQSRYKDEDEEKNSQLKGIVKEEKKKIYILKTSVCVCVMVFFNS